MASETVSILRDEGVKRRVTILGWYGTETTGDKAILAALLQQYQTAHPPCRVTIASIHPFVTLRTLRELGFRAQVIPTYSHDFIRALWRSDIVVMGGGPLMNLNELAIPLVGFLIGRLRRRKCIVAGCGLGPLDKPLCLRAVRLILSLATEISLRDEASVSRARQLVPGKLIRLGGDPAESYVRRRVAELKPRVTQQKQELACFLRDWPREYFPGDRASYEQIKTKSEQSLAAMLRSISQEHGLNIVLYPMHTLVVGGDDRDFNRRFIRKYLADLDAQCVETLSSVDAILIAMLQARLCVCMRYHSVLFAHATGRPYLAIDYTSGGKISGYLKCKGSTENMLSWSRLAQEGMAYWRPVVARTLSTDLAKSF